LEREEKVFYCSTSVGDLYSGDEFYIELYDNQQLCKKISNFEELLAFFDEIESI
jgi:hypothetical protein